MSIEYIRGKDVNLYIRKDGNLYPLGCGSSCSLSITTEIGERTTSNSGKFKQFKALAISGSLSAEGVTTIGNDYSIYDLHAAQLSLLPVYWMFEEKTVDGLTARTFSGDAVIENIEKTGEVSSMAAFSVNLIIDGEIAINYDPVPNPGVTVQIYYYTAMGGESDFTASQLQNKDVLAVFEDADFRQVVNVTPANQQAQYFPITGKIAFDHTLMPGVICAVMYQ